MTLDNDTHVCSRSGTLQRLDNNQREFGSRIGNLEGRLLVVEKISRRWDAACDSLESLKVLTAGMNESISNIEEEISNGLTKSIRAEIGEKIGSLKTQTVVTWALLMIILSALIGVAFKVFVVGGLP